MYNRCQHLRDAAIVDIRPEGKIWDFSVTAARPAPSGKRPVGGGCFPARDDPRGAKAALHLIVRLS
jgi:hypothetical protein